MKTIDIFKEKQEQTIEILNRLINFINKGEKLGIAINQEFIEKIKNGIQATKEKKLKVALIGGFSEGKTSVAAAWSEHYDKSTMLINQSESSDQIRVYSLKDFDLIDTPGLFGLKETKDRQKYKDVTKKYVSEANLILYVMNPNNPVKESHKEELNYFFKELNLLSRTVFVLSRFDEEADIEDEEDYQESFEIKRKNILDRLCDFQIITPGDDVPIVAVSANPFGKGINYWLSNLEEFKKLSHIETLQKATTEKIKSVGNLNEIILASQKSIVKDILYQQVPVIRDLVYQASEECLKLDEVCSDREKDFNKTKKKIGEARIGLREFITEYFTDLILQASSLSLKTYDEFIQRNIGKDMVVLKAKIDNEFDRYLGNVNNEILSMETKFKSDLERYDDSINFLLSKGLKFGGEKLSKVAVSNKTVIAVRNSLKLSHKFKPWEATKLAGKLSKGLKFAGTAITVGLQVYEICKKGHKEEEFKKIVSQLISQFEEYRGNLLESLNNEQKFISDYCPSYKEFENQFIEIQKEIFEKKELKNKFVEWENEGRTIEADFEIIN